MILIYAVAPRSAYIASFDCGHQGRSVTYFGFTLPPTLELKVWLFPSLWGRIMLIYWVELQTYHIFWRFNTEAGVEQ